MVAQRETKLEARVARAASVALERRQYVSAIDVLVGLGWLAPVRVDDWRHGRIQFLEAAVQADLPKISAAMQAFQAWADAARLRPSDTVYVDRSAGREPLQFSRSGDAAIERAYHAQLRTLATTCARAVALPADAFVIGEPVEIVTIDYRGHPRAGLTASCRRAGTVHEVGLADVTFLPGSEGARCVALYRAWLGLGEPAAAAATAAAPGKRHEATADDLDLSQPLDLIVLACKANTLRCRIPGTARELTLRTAVRDEVPGEIITVRPSKQWNHASHPYLSGKVETSRPDVLALGLTPLGMHEQGEWDPDLAYWGEEPIEDWARPIIARGKRPSFELEQVIPGADPEDFDSDPIIEASELAAGGARGQARALLMELLAQDLRCLDAHAHLGNLEFGRRPQQALRHYAVGMTIGVLTLGKTFDGVLEWG